MRPIKHFFAHLPLDTPRMRVRGIGIQERMRPGLIDRPAGTGDHLFMLFYGPVHLRPDGAARSAPAETLMLWKPGQAQFYGNPERSYTHSWIHCDGTAVRRILRQSRLPADAPLNVPDPSIFEQMVIDVYAELTGYARPDALIVEHLLEIGLRRIGRAVRREEDAPEVPDRFVALKAYMETAYREPLTLVGLAGRVHLSVPHLCAEFKRYFHTSVMDYVIRLRMHEAAHLLRDRNLTVTEVGRRVGYEDIYYFSRRFKQHFGVSPRAMRQGLGDG